MSAIEVLKSKKGICDLCKYDNGKSCDASGGEFKECKPAEEFYNAIKTAVLALEQKDNQVKWLISCLKTRLDLCKELREKDLDHYNKYIDIEIDFIYLSLERIGLNKSEIRKRVSEQK